GGEKDKEKKRKYEPPVPTRIGKKKKSRGPDSADRLPTVTPHTRCKLRLLKLERIKDYLLMEEEFIKNQERLKTDEEKNEEERSKIDDLRGSPMSVGSLEEIIDDNHAIVSTSVGSEHYVSVLSFVDKDLLEPGCSVLLNHKMHSVVGVLADDADPMVSMMKLDKAPKETYADIGGLDTQIQEIKESVELPLTHPELYEEMGIKPPKGVILYGAPGTGKTLLAKAVASATSATFLRVVGSELIQKYLGDGPKLVREIFRVAEEHAPSIVFIDEIDAVGTKRYESNSGGEREIQRTMLELLNQLDGFDSRGDVKVIMATNRIDSLDPALIRPGRIDRKIEFPLPDEKTKRRIVNIHTSKMTLADDVNLEEYIMSKEELSGADIKAICTEAGLLAFAFKISVIICDNGGVDFSSSGSGTCISRSRLLANIRHGWEWKDYICAAPECPFITKVGIDIRDTVNYKEVMAQYRLGPNGAILTCLNLFATKFDQVINLINSRRSSIEFVIVDTPGQIEAFTWSASGSIITEALAAQLPTVLVYVMDTPRSHSPVTFMSNMLYACSILYKTRLPFVVALNKTDIISADFAMEWMTNFEAFQEALHQERSYLSNLTRSMSLVLDSFYAGLRCAGVSAATGDGMPLFLSRVRDAVSEYYTDYVPMYEKLRTDAAATASKSSSVSQASNATTTSDLTSAQQKSDMFIGARPASYSEDSDDDGNNASASSCEGTNEQSELESFRRYVERLRLDKVNEGCSGDGDGPSD
uniref:AAA domain-containing protein n=2 Tax=Macrostomum lignano TaxID=282301 RepID=A0A1I8J0F0_9PLAT